MSSTNKNSTGRRRGAGVAELLLGLALVLGAGGAGFHAVRSVAGVTSNPASPWWLRVLTAVLSLAAVVLVLTLSSGLWRAWIFRGTLASFHPLEPVAGSSLEVRWVLPPRAAEALGQRAPVRLRVAQYRINEDHTGTSALRVQDFEQDIQPHRNPDGGLILQARFDLPHDAPTHGSRRSGELVEWRLELIGPNEVIELAESIPVQAVVPASEPDRFAPDRRRVYRPDEDLPPGSPGDQMPALPAGVIAREHPDALTLGFTQTGWRWFGLIMLAAAIGLATTSGAERPLRTLVCATLLAGFLHAISRSETLEVRDDALIVSRSSWLWQRRTSLSALCLEHHLYQQLDRSPSGLGALAFRSLWSRGGARGARVRLTPSLRGDGAVLIARMLHWGHAQRRGRFSPGAQRSEAASHSRPAWGWAVWLLLVVAALSSAG